MPSIGWTLRSKNRLLELSVGGRWYLGFTVALGVVAIYSGNNVIYLLESLLLSSLLFSGTLSEYSVTRVAVKRITDNIHAGLPGEDVFLVENLGPLPLYCLELGEYRGKTREHSAFLLLLPGRARVRVRSRQLIKSRGRHRWDGLVVSTSFPFGFARKTRFIPDPGSRIVWPARLEDPRAHMREKKSERGEIETVAGELCPVELWQDASRVHWPASARAGELLARPVRWTQPLDEVRLDLREPGPEMERRISVAAAALARRADTLVMIDKGEPRVIQGSRRGLDALALLPKEVA